MKKSFFLPLFLLFSLVYFSCDPEEDQNTGEAPICEFNCFSSSVNADETLILEDLSSGNPTSWEWSITPEYFNFENGTDAFDQNPEISFTHAGSYTVKLKVSNEFGSDELEHEDCIEVAKYSIIWTPLPDMPHARGMLNPVVFQDKIYLVGGTYEQDTPTDVFDPLSEEWEISNTPGCAEERMGHNTVVMNNNILVMGGFNGPSLPNYSGDPLNAIGNIEQYLPEENVWENYSSTLPRGKIFMNASVYKNELFVLGGSEILPFSSTKHSTDFRKFEPNSGNWSQLDDMPEVQTYSASVIHDDKLYIMGGEYPNSAHIGSRNINVYNLATDSWEDSNVSFLLQQYCFGAGCCEIKDVFILIGGQSTFATFGAVQIVDPAEKTSYSATKLPYSAIGIGVCAYDQKLYVFGGSSAIGGSLPSLKQSAYKGELIITPSIPK